MDVEDKGLLLGGYMRGVSRVFLERLSRTFESFPDIVRVDLVPEGSSFQVDPVCLRIFGLVF